MVELIARGILIRNGKILLSRKHKNEYYALIGGHIEDETLYDGLKREFKEETNLQVEIKKLLYIIENTYKQEGIKHFEVVFYFLCKKTGENFKDEREDATLKWMDVNKLKRIHLLPQPLKKDLIKDLEHGFQRRIHLLRSSKNP